MTVVILKPVVDQELCIVNQNDMQKPIKIIPVLQLGLKVSVIIAFIFIFLQMVGTAKASVLHLRNKALQSFNIDSSVFLAIQTAKNSGGLLYPLSVERFYAKNGNKLAWTAPEYIKTHAWDAMLLLDCVIQYGLIPADYHPTQLTYDQLHLIIEHPEKVSESQRAAYDILLTDALITLINNLHYGKLNVNYPPVKLDAGKFDGCHAGVELANALDQQNFITAIESLQPQTMAYCNLQYHMHLLTGLYTGDNYELSETAVKKMAINMERLRWSANDGKSYVTVNIPSFTLEFYRPDTVYQFRVLAGEPVNPTPSIESAINSIQVSKGWDAESRHIYFTFYNRDGVYLGNTPDQLSFKKEDRAVTDRTLNVEHAQKLAALLLTNDGNLKSVPLITKRLKKNEARTFSLKKKMPFNVSYITCAVNKGLLVTYTDIYQLDPDLEMKFYNVINTLALDLSTKK